MTYEKIARQEMDSMTNDKGFTPNYTYEEYVLEKDSETGDMIEHYINLTIHKTADEVYQEWLQNKDKPLEPTKVELLEEENKVLKAQAKALETQATFMEDCLLEMATLVYA